MPWSQDQTSAAGNLPSAQPPRLPGPFRETGDHAPAGRTRSTRIIPNRLRKNGAVGPSVERNQPGPTAQLLLRPCLKIVSDESILSPASGASARRLSDASGASRGRKPISRGSTSLGTHDFAGHCRKASGSRQTGSFGRPEGTRDLGVPAGVFNVVGMGHLPAQRGMNQGAAATSTSAQVVSRRQAPACSRHPRPHAHPTHRDGCRAACARQPASSTNTHSPEMAGGADLRPHLC
jgi:hypothetical protein